MGRIRKNIDIKGKNFWTLFDTGSRNTYVAPNVAKMLHTITLPVEHIVALGGKENVLNSMCFLIANIEKHPVEVDAYVLDDIGKDEEGKPIEILFGALAMQKWGIRPLPDEERLDMTHYSKEFVEF